MKPRNDGAIEVFLTWGEGEEACVLATAFVVEGGRFTLGEGSGCDAVVPSGALGALVADVVTWDRGPCLTPPRDARLTLDGHALPAAPTALRAGETARVSFGDFTVRAQLVAREAWTRPAGVDVGISPLVGFGLSAFAHAAILLVLALYLSPLAGAVDAEITRDEVLTMRRMLDASAERELAEARDQPAGERPVRRSASRGPVPAPAPPSDRPWFAGSREREAELAPRPNAGASPTRADELEQAANGGMVGLVRALKIDPGEPNAFKDVLANLDANAAQTVALFGDPPIDKLAVDGLALSGVGLGLGGKFGNDGPEAQDVAALTASLEARLASKDPGGFGCPGEGCPGHVSGERASGFRIRWRGDIALYGGLDEGAIHRVVEINWGRVLGCYGAGLRKNPALRGHMAVSFEIGAHGEVTAARDDGSDLPDPMVRACIVRAFYALTFAPPHAGTARVKYPFDLKPDE